MKGRFFWTRVVLTLVILGAAGALLADVVSETTASVAVVAAGVANLLLILYEAKKRPKDSV